MRKNMIAVLLLVLVLVAGTGFAKGMLLCFETGGAGESSISLRTDLLPELVNPALVSWNVWHSYPNGWMPMYDEYQKINTSVSYPDGLAAVYMYLIFGEQKYLDYAENTLRFTVSLINSKGVLMFALADGHSVSTVAFDPTELSYALVEASYVVSLDPSMMPYLMQIADAGLKFQSSSGLFASMIDAGGTITDSTDHFGTRGLGTALMRVYEVTGVSKYLAAGAKLVNRLWGLKDSHNLIWDKYDALTGNVAESTVRCDGQWQFVSLADYTCLLTKDTRYREMFNEALDAMYKTFWFGSYWNYRTGYDLLEYNQPVVVLDLLGMGKYVDSCVTDIGTRLINGAELSKLNLLIHATTAAGTPEFNTNTHVLNQMAAVQDAAALQWYANGNFDTALKLYRALVTRQASSHGFLDGLNALTGGYYHSFGTDYSRFRNGVWITWEGILLLLEPRSHDIKLDFGHGFTMPFRLGLAYGATMVDPDKFRVNLAQGYIKITVQSNGTEFSEILTT